MTVYGYARVSGPAQDHARQLAALTAAGCETIYSEKRSAAAGRARPELRRLVADLRPGDLFIVTELSRFARSARDALNVLDAVGQAGALFRSLGEPWADMTTPAGACMVTVFSAFAEWDRSMILARTADGRRHARARGVKLGRKHTLTVAQRRFIQNARAETPPVPFSDLRRLFPTVSHTTIKRAAYGAPLDDVEAPPRQVDLEERLRQAGG